MLLFLITLWAGSHQTDWSVFWERSAHEQAEAAGVPSWDRVDLGPDDMEIRFWWFMSPWEPTGWRIRCQDGHWFVWEQPVIVVGDEFPEQPPAPEVALKLDDGIIRGLETLRPQFDLLRSEAMNGYRRHAEGNIEAMVEHDRVRKPLFFTVDNDQISDLAESLQNILGEARPAAHHPDRYFQWEINASKYFHDLASLEDLEGDYLRLWVQAPISRLYIVDCFQFRRGRDGWLLHYHPKPFSADVFAARVAGAEARGSFSLPVGNLPEIILEAMEREGRSRNNLVIETRIDGKIERAYRLGSREGPFDALGQALGNLYLLISDRTQADKEVQ